MPANISDMLRSLVKAKQTASLTELRFLEQAVRTLPTGSPHERRSAKGGALAKGQRRTLN